MLVKDLIARLQEMPQDHLLVIDGYEGGVGSITADAVRITKIYENVHNVERLENDELRYQDVHSAYYNEDTHPQDTAKPMRSSLPIKEVVIISRHPVLDAPVFEHNDYFGIHEEVDL